MQKSKNVVKYFACGCRRTFSDQAAGHKRVTKKALPPEMMKAYNPKPVETGWYEWWQSEGHFSSNILKVESKPVFSMLLPPPNVTGTLHLGHALTCSIQDVLARWRRMHGDTVVWIPGTDHAGIATQVVVERNLACKGLGSRHDLGRDKFVEEVWQWREEKGDTICDQLRQLGVSLDWNRQFFTLDQHQSSAVKEAFVRLYEAGLVYRAEALVSWSCALRSAIADIEVEWREVNGSMLLSVPGYEQGVEFGTLTKVALPLSSGDGEVVIGTTRVETMLGDVAVAVHPADQRYSSLIGQKVQHPLRSGISIPIIADDFVDPNFGTGAVKITPAHDSADWLVGKRHNLECLSVITEEGLMAKHCGEFSGMKRFDARKAMIQRLAQQGFIRGRDPLVNARIPFCSRSGDVIEMLLKPQWFIKCEDMAKQAMHAVTSGKLIIDPPAFHKVWFDWLGNIRDWCVSRQLWWGHRVPAYLCTKTSDRTQTWVAARNEDEAKVKASQQFGTEEVQIQQDADVLDTWFSSALLPFTTMGWPQLDSPDLHRLYPLSVMETGHDIIFFWVARMVMLSTQLTEKLPFKKILLHGIICDADGRKMSKSLGNVIHPEDVINGTSLQELLERTKQAHNQGGAVNGELSRAVASQKASFPQGMPECGTDALRFTLCSHNVKNHSVTFDVNECHTNRLFCNKVWQAGKFVLSAVKQAGTHDLVLPYSRPSGLFERWILSRQANAVQVVESALLQADVHDATAAIKNFLYKEFCDVYLECSKVMLKNPDSALETTQVLLTCMATSLHLLAPFMPFLTEELYQYFPSQLKHHGSIHLESFPSTCEWQLRLDKEAEENVHLLLTTLEAVRRFKDALQVKKQQARVILEASGRELKLYHKNRLILKTLISCADLQLCEEGKVQPPSTSEVISPTCTIHLQGKHKKIQVSHRYEKLVTEIAKLEAITTSQSYREKAAENIQRHHQEKLERLHTELLKIHSLQTS